MQTITDIQQIAVVVALVAMVRDQFPKIDGKAYVFGLAAAIATGLCVLIGGDSVRGMIQHALVVALSAAGGMQVVSYHATKSADVASRLSLRAPPVPSLQPRGFARADTLFLAALFGLAVACIPLILSISCAGVQRRDVKTIVDITKSIVEEVCSPDDPTLDACIDKLLSSPKVQAARAAAHKPPRELDGGR